MEMVTLQAMAKINLGLDVLRRREDGYHEVKMVMQTVKLYDTLTLKVRKEKGIHICVGTSKLPADENNLITKAARLLYTHYSINEGVEISLTKRIPIAAGMAGGSTDAAATLVGMNHLFDLGCSAERLKELGVTIGADVPYCIQGGTALSEGIGERLTPLPAAPDCYLVIARPDIHVSTKYVYDNLHVSSLKHHPDIDAMVEAVRNRNLNGIADKMENILENVTTKEYPVIDKLKDRMRAAGAMNALMSGSGPTVFGLFEDKEKATQALEAIKKAGIAPQSFLTTFAPEAQVIVETR